MALNKFPLKTAFIVIVRYSFNEGYENSPTFVMFLLQIVNPSIWRICFVCAEISEKQSYWYRIFHKILKMKKYSNFNKSFYLFFTFLPFWNDSVEVLTTWNYHLQRKVTEKRLSSNSSFESHRVGFHKKSVLQNNPSIKLFTIEDKLHAATFKEWPFKSLFRSMYGE